jgi:hypothetical protein
MPPLSSFQEWDYISVFLSLASAAAAGIRVAAKVVLVDCTQCEVRH